MDFQRKHFDPGAVGGTVLDGSGTVAYRSPVPPHDVYVYGTRTILALNVALATRRPLLISGEPGSGKTTLARNAAAVLGWWYYDDTITSRTKARDLQWTFDALRRLNDATTPGLGLRPESNYVEPGPIWWAFAPRTAGNRGDATMPASSHAQDRGAKPVERAKDKAVLLLDEIDKADPDVPNDLLEPFDVRRFRVAETGFVATAARDVLLALTTNGERELPPAFLRRCVTLRLDPPTRDWFVQIAEQRLGPDELHGRVADEVMKLRKAARRAGLREPSTGEYLDALETCRELRIDPGSSIWADVAHTVIWKHDRRPELEPEETGQEIERDTTP